LWHDNRFGKRNEFERVLQRIIGKQKVAMIDFQAVLVQKIADGGPVVIALDKPDCPTIREE
jgi:hypothetical protein